LLRAALGFLRDLSFDTCSPRRFDFVAKLGWFPGKVDAVLRRDLAAALSVIYLDLNTDICNHRCTFCDGFYRPLTSGHLPWPRLDRLITEMEELGVLAVVLAGDRGEPLLHPHIDRVLARLADSTVKYALYTNGTVIKPELWPHLSKAAFIRVSVDAATPATHAAMHGYPAGRGDFGAVLANLQRLGSVVPDLGVSFVLTPGNAHEIAAAADRLLACGARFIEYTPHYLSGYTLDTLWLRSAATQIAREIARARDAWGARIVVNNQIDAVLGRRVQPLHTEPRPCMTSVLRLVISTHGCYTCTPYRGEGERRVGSILEQSLREVAESSVRRWLLSQPCSRLCAYHEQNEALLRLDQDQQADVVSCPPPTIAPAPQDFFI
jgi:MoaA/NifB/PqqE/SkfB family radical SAM enzyme